MKSNFSGTRKLLAVTSLLLALILSVTVFAQSGPSISAISPDSGTPGNLVTIEGSGFGATVGSSTVTFNGVPATLKHWSDTSITVLVPAGASTGPVMVSVSGVASNGKKFTVSQAQ